VNETAKVSKESQYSEDTKRRRATKEECDNCRV
jgi:hypothetical protein